MVGEHALGFIERELVMAEFVIERTGDRAAEVADRRILDAVAHRQRTIEVTQADEVVALERGDVADQQRGAVAQYRLGCLLDERHRIGRGALVIARERAPVVLQQAKVAKLGLVGLVAVAGEAIDQCHEARRIPAAHRIGLTQAIGEGRRARHRGEQEQACPQQQRPQGMDCHAATPRSARRLNPS